MSTLVRSIAFILLVSTGALATPPSARTLHRGIADGVATGELTTLEASRARSKLAVMRLTKIVLAADGQLDGADRAQLRRLRARATQTVWRLTHNRVKDHSRAVAQGGR